MMARDWSISTGACSGHRWWQRCLLLLLLWSNCVGVSMAQNCDQDDSPSVGVVVVASVFTTLAVVAILLVVAVFVLRKRNGGFLFPAKRARKSIVVANEDGDIGNHGDGCYENPAFSDRDVVDLEGGTARFSQNRHSSPGMRSPIKDSQKTWASFPAQRDFHEDLHRKGSCGSLDNSNLEPETVSVWLQSQDIIGLGFNICGNMRDGIYVSQVHNRGPAVQSGKIKVGDRITSVTIAYDNMVYEDALTILSYASPYPVQVTLQKERVISKDSRSSGSEQLNHPLYRSQSLDILQRIPMELPSKAKRTQSEMKSSLPLKKRKAKALSQSYSVSAAYSTFSATVHSSNGGGTGQAESWRTKDKSAKMDPMPLTLEMGQDKKQTADTRKTKLDTEAAREFAIMMDQTVANQRSNKAEEGEVIVAGAVGAVSTSPKTPPNKPQRKKKPSTVSIKSEDNPEQFFTGEKHVDEVFKAENSVGVHSTPQIVQDLGPEVNEDEIQPAHVKREINLNVNGFEFTPVEKREEPRNRSPSPNGFVYVKKTTDLDTSESESIEEEAIEPSVATRNAMSAFIPYSSHNQDTKEEADNAGEDERVQQEKGLWEESRVTFSSISVNNQVLDLKDMHSDFSFESDSQRAADDQNHASYSLNDTQNKDIGEESSEDKHIEQSDMTETLSNDSFTEELTSLDLPNMREPHKTLVHSQSLPVTQLQDRAGEDTEDKENHRDGLQWSGTRLVRSGSFSEIPLGDSLTDWADRNVINDDDDNSVTSEKRSSEETWTESDPELDFSSRPLPSKNIFKARENLANLSDLSNSIPSSGSSSPVFTNGPTEGLTNNSLTGGSDLGDVKNTTIQLCPTPDNNANSKTFRFTLNDNMDDDIDC